MLFIFFHCNDVLPCHIKLFLHSHTSYLKFEKKYKYSILFQILVEQTMDIEEFDNILLHNSVVFLSKPSCKLCDELSTYLQTNNIKYYKIDVNSVDYGLELVEHIKNTNVVQSFPICFKDALFVGTKGDLIKILFDSVEYSIDNI
jgi:glutaredoxin